MKAQRIFHDKTLLPDGSIVEMVIWQLPKASSERQHGLKYRLYFGFKGQRLVGYDNELGKGDHKHVGGIESRYKFTTIEKLVSDFLEDVERIRNEQNK